MEKITVNTVCQYWENYGYYDGGEHWKPKGGVIFTMQVDISQWMYDDQKCKELIRGLIADRNNKLVRYEVVDFETILDEPIDITEEFDKVYSESNKEV